MDPFSKTHGEELIELIKTNAPTDVQLLRRLYDDFDPSIYSEGVEYYFNQSEIKRRIIKVPDDNGNMVADPDATNHRLASGFHKLLVDQKTAYLSGEPMTFGSKSNDKKFLDLLYDLIGEDFEDTLPELIKNASNKGREWLHPYIDEDGVFQFIIIPAEQFIPIYEPTKRKELLGGIRFYEYSESIIKLEWWTDTDVSYYEIVEGELVPDAMEEVNPAPHYNNGNQSRSWGKVPFIEFANNEERVSDLLFVKDPIDAFDLLFSDITNTLDDMQSLIYVLKGYEGTNLAEFLKQLKRYKAIPIDAAEGSGIDTLKAEVPVEAVKTQIEELKQSIFAFGQGVNPNPDIIGDAPSGVALQNLYSLLDMKSSILERKFTRALRRFMWFVTEYLKISGQGEFDYRDITFSFNKMLLTNELEIIQMARDSVGIISNATIRENHPWVKDQQTEKDRLEKEQAEFDARLEPLGGEDEDEPIRD
ncbi:phage portal protein [Jeotgalibacillus soli]|uniref:Phage portal protein, SPP1 family n=1 Tax=Jeotgalibacillus soli TaxID=889306 RepID=A0A0C2VMT0_9BACL|nr:phage portal protein [Jeotgalibacillus soli]KIL45751.1 phage portal protein, SPP1 family [Jeotgalibacillus soli]